MSHPRRIEGYAIVSEDGMLADATGVMPQALKFEADQCFFERGLNRADVLVHGRHSDEQQANSASRRRLIATRRVEALAPDPSNPRAWLWNPAAASLDDALAGIGPPSARVGVIGGTEVFGLFLDIYDVFYLSRAAGVSLPGGRPVFPGVPARTPEAVMAGHGLTPGAPHALDRSKGLTIVAWRRSQPGKTPA